MTTDANALSLSTFPEWLTTLGADLRVLAEALGDESTPESARRAIAGALNYVFKSVDLIPDGIDDIGYLDDAFVMRVAASQAMEEGASAEAHPALVGLARDAASVKSFLGADYVRLDTYVRNLRKGAARGRSVDDIIADAAVRSELATDVVGFARDYNCPSFSREERTLIKLKAFFDARLPR